MFRRTTILVLAGLVAVSCGGGDDASTGGTGGTGGGQDGGTSGGDGGQQGSDGGSSTAPIAGLHVFFTDLTSGPNTGGENDKGVYVTIYGNGFGSSQGSSNVTVGGGAADAYPVWTDTKITMQLGAAAKTGDIVVHVPAKGDSNAVPFTVRAGNVYFVTSSGDDGGDGSFAHPWKTIPRAKDGLRAAGDTLYVGTHAGDSVSQTTLVNYNSTLSIEYQDGTNTGTADAPKAIVAYPGATATIGVESGVERGLLVPAITGTFDYWVIAGLTLRGEVEALDFEGPADGWRVVGNDISCPNGTGTSGCVNGSDGPTNLKMYGNVVHDAASKDGAVSKYYHGIYFGSSHLDIGWNVVRDGKTCRAIQFHDTGGPNEFDVHVHDNLIHDTVCDGINFSTVDPSKGVVEAYGNVIYRVGKGPDPDDGAANYAGIYVYQASDNNGEVGSGTVEIYGNTLYDCGGRGNSDSGAFIRGDADGDSALTMHLVDNLVLSTGSETYVTGTVTGSNDSFFGGAGTPPASLTAGITVDPALANPAAFDFHLTASSPVIDKGTTTTAAFDFDGNPRPQGAGYDIGAYEFTK